MTQPNPSTAQARVIADELQRHGVRLSVIAPGSRSRRLSSNFVSRGLERSVLLILPVGERFPAHGQLASEAPPCNSRILTWREDTRPP